MDAVKLSVVSLIISGISAIVTLLAFLSNRSMLIFFNDKDIDPMPIIEDEINAVVKNKQGQTKAVPFPEGILYHFQVFNPSPKDIAFFNMGFIFDKQLHQDVWTLKTLGWFSNNPKIILKDPLHGAGEIYIPQAPQGVFRAHSFTPLYCFVSTANHPFPKNVRFRFKYAVRKFPFIGRSTYYKEFVRDLNVSNIPQEIEYKNKFIQQCKKKDSQSTKAKHLPPYRQRHKHSKRHKD